jgi:hypothetical protein
MHAAAAAADKCMYMYVLYRALVIKGITYRRTEIKQAFQESNTLSLFMHYIKM